MAKHVYFAVFHPEAGGGYSVSFPDVPGAISEGCDFLEALENARDALETLLDSLIADGEALPPASQPEKINAEARGALISAIAAETESKTVRVNVSLGERLLAQIDRAAERSGQTRSGFLAHAARRLLDDDRPRERKLEVVQPVGNSLTTFGTNATETLSRELDLLRATLDRASIDLGSSFDALLSHCTLGTGEELLGPLPEPLTSFGENVIVTVAGNRAFKHLVSNPGDTLMTASATARTPSS